MFVVRFAAVVSAIAWMHETGKESRLARGPAGGSHRVFLVSDLSMDSEAPVRGGSEEVVEEGEVSELGAALVGSSSPTSAVASP